LAKGFRLIGLFGNVIAGTVPACLLFLVASEGAAGQNLEVGTRAAHSEIYVPFSLPPSPGDSTTQSERQSERQSARQPEPHSEQIELLGRVDGALDEIEGMIEDAYFRTALAMVDARRRRFEELGLLDSLNPRRARLEVLAATAAVALDLRVKAMRSMRRALRAEPELILDEQLTPPKVHALLREARLGRTFRNTR
jgi:hypothetical protein